MSIADVPELVMEAARISGRSDLPQFAKMLTGFLESQINNTLRVRQMVTSATLATDSDGVVALPSDYRETVVLTYGTDKRHLNRITREIKDAGVTGYYIDGTDLVSSKTGTAHTLTYYQSVPGLWANGSNWLFTAFPQVYLRGLVMEAHKDAGDLEAATRAAALFAMALGEVTIADTTGRRNDVVAMPRTQI